MREIECKSVGKGIRKGMRNALRWALGFPHCAREMQAEIAGSIGVRDVLFPTLGIFCVRGIW